MPARKDIDTQLSACSDFTRQTIAAIGEIILAKHRGAERRPLADGFSYWNGKDWLLRVDPKQEYVAVKVSAEMDKHMPPSLRVSSRAPNMQRWVDVTPENRAEALRFLEARVT